MSVLSTDVSAQGGRANATAILDRLSAVLSVRYDRFSSCVTLNLLPG
jgi:hypothetical protein